jgi:hypothetical protein
MQEETYRRVGVGAYRRMGFAGNRRVRSRLSWERATLMVVDLGHALCGSGLVTMNILGATCALNKGEG